MANARKNNSKERNNYSTKGMKGRKAQGQQRDIMGTPYSNEYRNGSSNKTGNQKQSRNGAYNSTGNPVSLYTKFDQFAHDAAKLPFATPVGATLTVDDIYSFITPGLMRIRFTPAIGVSHNFASPINRSSIRFYTYLRSNQKASATYDHQDITMMMVALDSCYMFHALMARVYATVNLFTPANEYYSRAVVAASGVKFDDIRANLQDFRAYINSFAYSLGQYALPSDIAMFDRHRWMCEGIYTDGTSRKAQTYMFVPDRFYRYDNSVATGSQCVTERWLSADPMTVDLHTFADIKAFGDKLLNAISNDEDFAVISGDIYNFYGGKTYSLPYIGEDYAVLPKYDEIVLSQIENAMVMGDILNDSITQNPDVNAGAIIYEPRTKSNASASNRVLMNFHHDSPTPDEILEATRLMVQESAVGAPEGHNNIISCGTEIVTGLDIWSRNPNTMAYRYNHVAGFTLFLNNTDYAGKLLDIVMMGQFDWAPCIHVYTVSGESVTFIGLTWDVENAESVAGDYLANIHLASLLSLFTAGVNNEA